MPIMPDRNLIQHEWRAHGSCSGLTPAEYFGNIRAAYSRLRIPRTFGVRNGQARTAPEELAGLFSRSAGTLGPDSVRVACRNGELSEIRVCLSRNLEPIPCSNQVGECHSNLVVRPIP